MENDNIAVFWDYENCEVPATVDGFAIANGIRRIAHEYGSVKTFRAYSAMSEASSLRTAGIRSDLQACGVSVIDCPHNGRKDTADKMMLVDIMAFVCDSLAPTTIILITGDGDFLYTVSTIRLRKCRVVLLAPPQCSSPNLKGQATAVYDWPRDVLAAELPEPSHPAPIGSLSMTFVATHSKSSPASGGRHGTSTPSTDFNHPSASYAVAASNSKAVSQPNTPQTLGPSRLPSNSTVLTRPRASSVQQSQQHNRSISMSQVPQTSAMAHASSTPKTQLQYSNAPIDSSQRLGRLDPPHQIKNNDRKQTSPWPLTKPIIPTPSLCSGALSPLAPTINVDGPQDLASHEEEETGDDDGDATVQDGSLRSEELPEGSTNSKDTPGSSSVCLALAEEGLPQVYEQPPMQLPLSSPDGEGLLEHGQLAASSSSTDSEDTMRADNEIPPGYHMVVVRENMVIPSIEMTRLRGPPFPFEVLIDALEEERLKGNTRVISSQLGGKVLQADKHIYRKASVTKLSEYIAKALEKKIIITGNLGAPLSSNGNVWVALHPLYHGKPPSVPTQG